MSTIEKIVSMLEVMPEESRLKVLKFTQALFLADEQGNNPFVPLTSGQILEDLSETRAQIDDGKGIPAEEALNEIGRAHGFL